MGVNLQLTELKNGLMTEAERLVIDVFPERYCHLDSLLQDKFSLARLDNLQTHLNIPQPSELNAAAKADAGAPPAKKRRGEPSGEGMESSGVTEVEGTVVVGFVGGSVDSNAEIVELMELVKPIVREAVEAANKVKMWISYLIPRIEDGNNFGVSIQEDTLGEVRTVEAEAASFLDQISRYLLQRGRLICKAAKYPHVEDFRRSVADMDEKQFLNLRLTVTELRNHYGTLHDVITKNLDKIKTPRTNNTQHLY